MEEAWERNSLVSMSGGSWFKQIIKNCYPLPTSCVHMKIPKMISASPCSSYPGFTVTIHIDLSVVSKWLLVFPAEKKTLGV